MLNKAKTSITDDHAVHSDKSKLILTLNDVYLASDTCIRKPSAGSLYE